MMSSFLTYNLNKYIFSVENKEINMKTLSIFKSFIIGVVEADAKPLIF